MRPAQAGDFDAVLDLIAACDIEEFGRRDYDAADLRDDWSFAPLEDISRVLVDAGDQIVGYAHAFDRVAVRPTGAVYTHPAHRGRGIGTALTRWLTERALARLDGAPPGARVLLEFGASADNASAMDLLRNEGFEPHRYMLRMSIDLEHETPAPAPPPGIVVGTFNEATDARATYEAVEESFSDHWGHTPRPYEMWEQYALRRPNHDPSLWFIARSGHEIAGVALCSDHPEIDDGFINTVGVRRPWRRTGVAMALLLCAFAAFRERGRARASLGVDAQSLTGATRLYERAGMRVVHRFAMCAKEIRPGIDTTVQELAG